MAILINYLADVSQVILVFLLWVTTKSNLCNRVLAHENSVMDR